MSLGTKLHALRSAKDMSLRQVAKLTGLGFSTISRAERGGIPDIATLDALARFYGVSIDDLIDGEEATQEQVDAFLIGHGYNLEKLRTEINALIDELKRQAQAVLAQKERP